MKIIFLDIDGVLNSSEYRKRMGRKYYADIIDRSKMPLLKKIVEATDARIVLSTSWRKFWNEGESQLDSIGEQINTVFSEFGLSVYSKTPVIENAGRNAEIKAWLEENRYVDGYVILDDKNFCWSIPLKKHFVQTDRNGSGLEDVAVKAAIDVLDGTLISEEKNNADQTSDIRTWLKTVWKKIK